MLITELKMIRLSFINVKKGVFRNPRLNDILSKNVRQINMTILYRYSTKREG